MKADRRLTSREIGLLLNLIDLANAPDLADEVPSLRAREMNDGGMGSLQFIRHGGVPRFGRQAAQLEFIDSDGVVVSAALNLDAEGHLFELDMFKSDFSPVRAIPELRQPPDEPT